MTSPAPPSEILASTSVDVEHQILQQIHASFLSILHMLQSIKGDLGLLGDRFDRLEKSCEKARRVVKKKQLKSTQEAAAKADSVKRPADTTGMIEKKGKKPREE